MSWIDISDTQLMFQLNNERAGFSMDCSLIFRKVFQRLLNRNQCNYNDEPQCGFCCKNGPFRAGLFQLGLNEIQRNIAFLKNKNF
jgi:hypothetical protein